jgi:MFS transporter, SP family, sugar:H+ symporter
LSRLLSKGRREEAVKSLQRLRKKSTSVETIAEEIEVLSHFDANDGKGPWKEVFNKENRVCSPYARNPVILIAKLF